MFKTITAILIAFPLAAHANYYNGRGNYVITPAPSYSVVTPQGTWMAIPNNPVRPNAGYTIYAPPTPVVLPPPNPNLPALPSWWQQEQDEWIAKHCKITPTGKDCY